MESGAWIERGCEIIRSMNRTAKLVLMLGLAALALAAGWWFAQRQSQPAALSAVVLGTPRQIPAELTLTSHRGEAWNTSALNDAGLSYVFFGFTHCPDVCPATLAILAEMAALLDDPPQVILVTVDPERDDPDTLGAYLAYFDDRFLGLTGPAEVLDVVYKTLGVAVYRAPQQSQADYTVDHSAGLFVVDGAGAYRALYRPPFDASVLAAEYPALMRRLLEE